MENTKSFGLNAAVRSWRMGLAQSPAFRAENLEELEEHLRDSVCTWQAKGLSEEESFLIATRRLGNGSALGEEFGKFNSGPVWRARVCWMLAGVLVYSMTLNFSEIISSLTMLAGKSVIVNALALGFVGLTGKCVVAALLVSAGYLCVKGGLGRRIDGLLQRRGLSLALLLLAMIGLSAAARFSGAVLAHSLPARSLGPVYLVAASLGQALQGLVLIISAIVFVWLQSSRVRPLRIGRAVTLFLAVVAAGLATGCNKSQPAATTRNPGTSASQGQTELEQCLALWQSNDRKPEAVVAFMKVDWTKRPLFAAGSPLGFSETQFMALPRAAREKLSKPMLDDIALLRAMVRQVDQAGADALAKGDKAAAAEYYAQIKKCGEALSGPDSLALTQMVGKALVKRADAQLGSAGK